MLVFFVAGRYRAPMIPALAVAAGTTLTWMAARLDQLRAQAARRLAGAALLVALVVNLTWLPILESRDEIELTRLARALADEERYDEALARLERLLDLAEAQKDQALYERARLTALEIVTMKIKKQDK
jgi:hypothetical protein